ncbi:MAG TPA: SusC/RagA family TonB-linked outer membrane protein, partial [Cyclobacteriaceae bacterium]|nr:SusC/RagA family TonB-linked outer membrane protein [Cyclobacteriaceae bacterium]
MRKILQLKIVFVVLLFSGAAWAQTRTISGKVTSVEDGTPLPGVNVVVKGTTNGTTTDADGKYSLSLSEGATTLTFSFIGLATQQVDIGDRTIVDIQMANDVKQLSEIVVVGYGTQERKDLTGSLASVKGSDISNLATPSFDQQLAGRASGVNVSIPSGLIGQAPVIRVRGVNSISNGADPLIVVDNMPITTGSNSAIISNNALADINPNDIESFEVLKDGSATAIYGSRGANGVILITTKKGRKGSGKAQVSYDNYFGWANTFKRYDVLNANQFVQIQNEKFTNAGSAPQANPMTVNGKPVDTNWQDQVFRTGFIQNHALSVSGASDKTSYFFSVGWTDQKGATMSNALQRYTFRSNFDHKATKWLSIGTDMGLTRTKTIGLNAGSNALSGNIFNALNEFPNVPVYNADGTYNIQGAVTGRGANLSNNQAALPNIAYVLAHNVNNATAYRLVGNAHAEASVLKDFKIRTQIGVDALFNDDFLYRDPKQGDGFPSGTVFQQFSPTIRWNWQNTVNYIKILAEDHKINVTGGFEYQKATFSNYAAFGQNLSNPYFGQFGNIIGGTLLTQQIGGDLQENGFSSYFGRANYSYKDKYLVQGTFRSDALSSLAPGVRTGFFPGASLGWRISNEEFFKSASFLSSVSALKLRASYAQVGNSFLQSNYPYADTFTGVTYGVQNGLSYGNTGNINLKWETSKKLDYGLDLGLFNDRITLTADYYLNKVDGLIIKSPTAPSLGIPGNAIFKNVGALENSGIELRV